MNILKLIARIKPDQGIHVEKIRIGKIQALVLTPEKTQAGGSAMNQPPEAEQGERLVQEQSPEAAREKQPVQERPTEAAQKKNPVLLWIHGGGYFIGMKEMVYLGRAADLVKKYGVTVVAPGYRLSLRSPYPAAIDDCYQTLLFLKEHAEELAVDEDRIMVGGESAGGGLTAALCMLARDRGAVKIAFQFPLYPMLSNLDTDSSRNNHGRIWNTKRNHFGWKTYLRKDAKKKVSPYAAAIHQEDFRGLPPAYTFVGDGEPFYAETLEYVRKLNEAGVAAQADVYPSDMHAFDMLEPETEVAKAAIRTFEKQFEKALAGI